VSNLIQWVGQKIEKVMGMICKICSHIKRLEIDRAIVGGGSVAEVARRFGVSYDSLWAHSQSHMSKQLAVAMEKKQLEHNYDLLQRIDTIIGRAEDIFHRNYKKGADVTALKALDSQRSTIELLAKISYSLHQAKMAEQELLNQNSVEFIQNQDAEHAKKLEVLTIPELEMLQKLSEKMENQDRSMIIIPESDSYNESITANTPMTRTNLPKRSFQQETPVNRRNAALLSPLDGVQESWQPEPGKKYDWINGKAQKPVEDERKMVMDDPKVLESIRRLNHGR
jgi:transposase-like protein